MKIGKLFSMFRRAAPPPDIEAKTQAMDIRIQEQRQLARLAKSEAIDRLFQGVVDDFRGGSPSEHS